MAKIYSIVQFCPEDPGHKCGYCKSQNGFVARGMWAHVLNVEEYQDLIDLGWRRSGKYCYKPAMAKTCCPLYTIRCDALNFSISKSQKKVLRRMRAFLSPGKTDEEPQTQKKSTPCAGNVAPVNTEMCTRAYCGKKKEFRLQRWQRKHNQSVEKPPPAAEPSLEDLLAPPQDGVHRLQVRLVASHPPSEPYTRTKSASFEVYKRYQMSVHHDAEDDCTMESFERFLGSSPLKGSGRTGSFHQQYWLDEQLIAVGVLDVLPRCVSSKYFFYDPSFGFLSLGTYSTLREICLVRELHSQLPSLRHYYMGYYIHSCPKMRYKGGYRPSSLLCPETYSWCPIESCLPLLDRSAYSRLAAPQQSEDDSERPGEGSLSGVRLLYAGRAMSFSQYVQSAGSAALSESSQEEVREYLSLVGPSVASRTLLYRD